MSLEFDTDSFDFNINAVVRGIRFCVEHPKYEKLYNERKKKVGLKQITRRRFFPVYFNGNGYEYLYFIGF